MNTCNAMEIWYNPSLPPVDSRNVLIKAKGYPDICTGFYSKGKWFSSCDFNDKDEPIELEVESWRDFPAFNEKKIYSFRSAEEARMLSQQVIQAEENNEYDMHFFEVRALIIKATSVPHVWSVNIGERPMYILEQLIASGFVVEECEDGTYEVSWDKTADEYIEMKK